MTDKDVSGTVILVKFLGSCSVRLVHLSKGKKPLGPRLGLPTFGAPSVTGQPQGVAPTNPEMIMWGLDQNLVFAGLAGAAIRVVEALALGLGPLGGFGLSVAWPLEA